MVADQPVEPQLLARAARAATLDQVEAMLRRAHGLLRGRGPRASSSPRWPAATATRATPTWRPYVERFVLEGQSARLSAAALETLAIVAYKQPISRAQVAAIRGVNVDGVVRTLEQRGYIMEVGRDPGPGQPVAVRHHLRLPREARAWHRSTTCRPSPTSCPGPRWSSSSSRACGPRSTDEVIAEIAEDAPSRRRSRSLTSESGRATKAAGRTRGSRDR